MNKIIIGQRLNTADICSQNIPFMLKEDNDPWQFCKAFIFVLSYIVLIRNTANGNGHV